ncbi:hypothetical protein WMY93_021563 [Mugilogobius chulae]|uniref:BPTI/Kunitz inhibitor domain-containing protein n=1 Tax=Mugilogobius chulae TaxID=88201 RepID=A0AAW0NN98_9GOBI
MFRVGGRQKDYKRVEGRLGWKAADMDKCLIVLLVLVCWTPQGQSADGDKQTPDYCNLSPKDSLDKFECTAYMPQFFYNSTSQECESFIYGGCGGNQNRFGSKKTCLETCHPGPVQEVKPDLSLGPVCVLAFFRESVIFLQSLDLVWHISHVISTTPPLRDMYCRAVQPKSSVCELPPETGPCRAAFHKLFYNAQTQRCEPFIYGGCEGNANRFDSAEECQHLCHPGGSDTQSVGRGPIIVAPKLLPFNDSHLCPGSRDGSCRMNVPRYFYNSTSEECEAFVYGGCEGNGNRFVSRRECHLHCPARDPTSRSRDGARTKIEPMFLRFQCVSFLQRPARVELTYAVITSTTKHRNVKSLFTEAV